MLFVNLRKSVLWFMLSFIFLFCKFSGLIFKFVIDKKGKLVFKKGVCYVRIVLVVCGKGIKEK